jgi:hypothetical protein
MQCVIPQWYIARWCLRDLVLKSTQPRWVFYSLRSIIFCIWWFAKYILFYKSEPIVCWLWSVLDDLSTLSMLKLWWCFEIWIWYAEFEWMVWLYVLVRSFEKLWLHWNMNVILEWVFYSLRSIIFIYDDLQNIYCFTNPNQLYVDYDLFWMIWVLLSILKLWWCFEVWICICGVWMNGVTLCYGWEFWKTVIALEHECDFRVSILLIENYYFHI